VVSKGDVSDRLRSYADFMHGGISLEEKEMRNGK
jgi:hypothetical protein